MSPKTWLALLVFSLTLLFTTSPVLADGLPVGVLSFDLLKTDVSGSLDGLDVTDYTQPGGGSSVSSFLGFLSKYPSRTICATLAVKKVLLLRMAFTAVTKSRLASDFST